MMRAMEKRIALLRNETRGREQSELPPPLIFQFALPELAPFQDWDFGVCTGSPV
ncbi:MAG: hypothetical protein KatS3mg053_1209 [Candidatus Roseilinea sp.]|jgi:hypothetical protein|nr:MAG: hypothetical protein KatS3mg053_1209 [Candidatus Roseilinea sp.]